MKKVALKIEDLEERIAPSFTFTEGSTADDSGADPTGGQGDLEETFGPNSSILKVIATTDGWIAHQNDDAPLDNGGNA